MRDGRTEGLRDNGREGEIEGSSDRGIEGEIEGHCVSVHEIVAKLCE